LLQNFAPAGWDAPHWGQWMLRVAPQLAQNFAPSGFAVPHVEQFIHASHATQNHPPLD
jgi:hypothetical protein